ncbi:uncharacterized protein LOC119735094 [Patiria miniata]|uniref:DDE-1 domain-containing protein n=1 Tax=Patiria miniata TaxID=46514 RepID=A0A914AMR3_PATMI|nr:uncharacterized protein LOC119735094 [Patiria miniata]
MWKVKALPNMCTSPLLQSRTTSYRNYSPTALSKAFCLMIDENGSVGGAARRYGVPESTLRDRVLGKVDPEATRSGPAPVFSLEEENNLVDHLKKMALLGYGYSRAEVIDTATIYAVSLNKRDEDHPLSLKWFRNFMTRWPELSVKKPRSLDLYRAKATSEEVVMAYFAKLDEMLTKYKLKDAPERIFNVDEKGLKQNHSPPFIVGSSSSSTPLAVTSGRGMTVTIIGAGNALGQQVPPYFVFPGQRMRQELLNGCLPGTDGTVSESGWSNTAVFMTYLSTHFLKYMYVTASRTEDEPILLLYDGHRSHINLPLIDWARDQHILLFVLPAHTSHVLQPLDLACFGPFEKIYNSLCHRQMRANSTTGIDRYSVCEIACNAYTKALSPENLRSSFKKGGIYPLNSGVVDRAMYAPARALNKCTSNPATKEGDFPQVSEVGPQGDHSSADGGLHDVRPDLFKEREDSIGQRKKVPKKRRCLSSVVSGKPITEEVCRNKIAAYQAESKKTPTSRPLKTKAKKVHTISSQQSQPGPSSPPALQHIIASTRAPPSSDNDSASDIDDTADKCCVCRRVRPIELAESIYFTSWGQCMFENCMHWTHIKYCCSVTRLRAKDTFYCPCHGLPCLQPADQ